jgi:hypothetical protein
MRGVLFGNALARITIVTQPFRALQKCIVALKGRFITGWGDNPILLHVVDRPYGIINHHHLKTITPDSLKIIYFITQQ